MRDEQACESAVQPAGEMGFWERSAMRRRWLAGLLLHLLSAGALLLGADSALAAEPVVQGWWTVSSPGGLPAQPPSAPDVPSDGLLVQGGPSSPGALAALDFQLLEGETAGTLSLQVAPNTATTPSAMLVLCPLTVPRFSPEQGGPLADAPAYDCAKKVVAQLDSAGTTFTADVGSLVSQGSLAIALLPGDTTSRIVLNKPGASALTTTVTPAPGSVAFGTMPDPAPSGSTGAGSAGSPPLLPAAPVLPVTTPPIQVPVVASPVPSGAVNQASGVNSSLALPSSGASNGGHSRTLLVLLIGVCVAAVLWAFAGAGATGLSAEPPGPAAARGPGTDAGLPLRS